MDKNVIFLWTGKVEEGDWFHLCILSLKAVSDCNIFVSSPELKEGSAELLESMGVKILWFDKKLWENRRIACKVERVNDLLCSLPEDDKLMIFDGDMLFLKNPFDAFENDFDYCYTTRNVPAWVATNAGCWGFRNNKRARNFMEIYVQQMNNPTWEPYVEIRMNHPHKPGLDEKDWWIEQDFSSCIHNWSKEINEGLLEIDVRVLDITCKYNYIVTGLTKEQIDEEIKTKRNYVLHFKGGSFGRWVNGLNTRNDQMIKMLGDNYDKFFKR